MRTVNTLVWHYTATPRGRETSVDEVRRWHLKRGFRDVGYHKLVHLDGTVSEGRPEGQVGAHVRGHNRGTIGYCYVGGLNGDPNRGVDTRTPAQKRTMERLTRAAIERYGLTDVCGHRDLAATDCPGFNVRAEYGHLLRSAVAGPPEADPASEMGDLKRSRTVKGAGAVVIGDAAALAEPVQEAVWTIQGVQDSLSSGSIVTLVVGAVIMVGALAVLYARWDDAGRPRPW